MKFSFLIILLFLSFSSFSQSKMNGVVQDKNGAPIFAANVYLKSFPQKGVISDFDGNFSLNIVNLKDTLIISFIGYKTKEILISTIDISKKIIITLKENNQTLDEVIITAKNPISEQFVVVKMEWIC